MLLRYLALAVQHLTPITMSSNRELNECKGCKVRELAPKLEERSFRRLYDHERGFFLIDSELSWLVVKIVDYAIYCKL